MVWKDCGRHPAHKLLVLDCGKSPLCKDYIREPCEYPEGGLRVIEVHHGLSLGLWRLRLIEGPGVELRGPTVDGVRLLGESSPANWEAGVSKKSCSRLSGFLFYLVHSLAVRDRGCAFLVSELETDSSLFSFATIAATQSVGEVYSILMLGQVS